MRIRWTRPALFDLEEIDQYLSKENQKLPIVILKRIRAAAGILADHAEIGRLGRVSGTRELIVAGTPFILPYRICSNEIQILRVLHSSRKWPSEFNVEE